MAVEEWGADLQASRLGPSVVRQASQVLNSMTKLAVGAGNLLGNPVTGVKAARQTRCRGDAMTPGCSLRCHKPLGEPRGHSRFIEIASGDAEHKVNSLVGWHLERAAGQAQNMVSACHANLLLPPGRGWFLAIRTATTAALSANSG